MDARNKVDLTTKKKKTEILYSALSLRTMPIILEEYQVCRGTCGRMSHKQFILDNSLKLACLATWQPVMWKIDGCLKR